MAEAVVRGVGSGQPYTEYGDSDIEVGVTRYALSGVCHRFVRRGIATPTRRANGPPSRDSFPICSRWNAKSNATMPLRTGLYRLRKNVSLGPRYRYAATRTRIFRLLNRSPLPLFLSLSFSFRSSRIRDERFVSSSRLLFDTKIFVS